MVAVRALIAMGANVNQTRKRSGSTPLHRAVTPTGAPDTAGMQAEAREIVALLLAAGADPSILNKNGKTPGDYATEEIIRTRLVASMKTATPNSQPKRRNGHSMKSMGFDRRRGVPMLPSARGTTQICSTRAVESPKVWASTPKRLSRLTKRLDMGWRSSLR